MVGRSTSGVATKRHGAVAVETGKTVKPVATSCIEVRSNSGKHGTDKVGREEQSIA